MRAAALALGALVAVAPGEGALAQGVGRVWLEACLKTAWNAGDSGTRCIGRVARHCIDRPESDTVDGEIACYRREAAIWDEMMGAELAALTGAIGPAQAERLRETQSQWLRTQTADCRMPAALIQGSQAEPHAESCRMETTAERALMVRRWRLLVEQR